MTRSLSVCAFFISALVFGACKDVPIGGDGVPARRDGSPDVTSADQAPALVAEVAPDAVTCSGVNPAAQTCPNTPNGCIPSSCYCDADGTWRCTTDCRLTLPLCTDGGAPDEPADVAPDAVPDAVACNGANPAAQTCRKTANDCIPSICECAANGSWGCTADCRTNLPLCADGGAPDVSADVASDAAPDAVTCSGTNPSAQTCRKAVNDCIPSSCSCSTDGFWRCTADCPLNIPLCADGGAPGSETRPPNPCDKCAATEVCLQWFDGTCHTSGVFCQAVSESCRSKLSASGVKSCKSFSECNSEFCSSPYQCMISPPCGTEVPEAALYCYGP